MTQATEMRIVCGRVTNPCGFNVDTDYFRRKTRFAPRICPNCNWGIAYADARTYRINTDLDMDTVGPARGMVFSVSERAKRQAAAEAVVE